MMVPTGFRFSPTDEELIEILNQKVSGNIVTTTLDFIVETNLYEVEPQHLQWTQSVALNKNERYYFCKRESDSREVMGRGWWKATSHVKIVSSASNGGAVGYKRPLTFHRFPSGDHIHNQRKRKDAIKTDWIMHEYGLVSTPTKWKLCKIKYKGKERLKEDMMMMMMMAMENNNIKNNNSSTSEGGELSSSTSTNPMLLEFAYHDHQDQQQYQPLPIINNDNYNENHLWSTNPSNMRILDDMIIGDGDHHGQQLEYSSLFDPSCSRLPYSYDHFVQQPFADLWS